MSISKIFVKIAAFLVITLLWAACQKEASNQLVESQNNALQERLSGVVPDDPFKLSQVPIIMSADYLANGLNPSVNPVVSLTTRANQDNTLPTTVILNSMALPSSVKLTMPPVMNQGGEGSCVSFALVYAISFEKYNRSNATTYSTSTNIFSPEFIFNQVKSDAYCTGSSLLTSLNLLVNKGVCTWASMPYTSAGCTILPNSTQFTEAVNNKIVSYSRILKTDQVAIKTMIASKRALVSSITIDDNFRKAGIGYIWKSFSTNPKGHAMAICGYDDSKHAYLAVNAWGTTFGDAGYIWIDYDFLPTVSPGLYVMNF